MKRLAMPLLIAAIAMSCAAPVTAPTPAAPSPSAAAARPEIGEQQEHEAGLVTLTAAWVVGGSTARIGMDTHAVDLDGFDLKQLARVRLDGGEWISPTAWDAPLGGHHRAGTLTFGSIDPKAMASAGLIELEVRDVVVPSHLLRWERAR